MIAYSFAHAFGLSIFIVCSMNIVGERQHFEKFVPKTIKAILGNKKIILHGKRKEDLSSRCWIHARNVADALLFLLDRARREEFYHIVGEERIVLEIADWIYEAIKGRRLNDSEIEFLDYHTVRPDIIKDTPFPEKMAETGWRPRLTWKTLLKKQLSGL